MYLETTTAEQNMRLKALIAVAALALMPAAAHAKFQMAQLEKVPIAKLSANLENRLKNLKTNDTDRALLEFQIGRLHSMAYALKTEEAQCRKDDGLSPQGGMGRLPFYGYTDNGYRQFEVEKEKDPEKLKRAKAHLEKATTHLRKALALNAGLDKAKLGYAWCLEQSGQRAQAIPLYREVIKVNYEDEKKDGGFRGTSVVEETVGYLIPLLDKTKDAKEIADLKKKTEEVVATHRTVTPIVVPLRAGVRDENLMQSADVLFDLDGNGPLRYSMWPSADAGWLVYDQRGTGQITSGLDLFGMSTFWLFWNDGYQALSALDADSSGSIEGDEKRGLAIWRDVNLNGVSEPGEVRTLDECGIDSLSCRARQGKNGVFYSNDGVRFKDGSSAKTIDWLVHSK